MHGSKWAAVGVYKMKTEDQRPKTEDRRPQVEQQNKDPQPLRISRHLTKCFSKGLCFVV